MSTDESINAFKKKYGDCKQWTPDNIEKIIKEGNEMGVNLDFILNRALNRKASKEVIAKIIYVSKRYPREQNAMKIGVASHMQFKSFESILSTSADIRFQPFIIASIIQDGKVVNSGDNRIIAQGAIKAAAVKPDAIDLYGNIIQENFSFLDVNDIIRAALQSTKGMKFILSTIVPKIIKGDNFALHVMQVLCAEPNGSPARLVANDLRLNYRINCIF
ncbi:hypothetical protein TVAG_038840 [Trichomonas vaginalis G3]|uniref:Uncharacterized protein n=1 Tax=Trichomonas vaginalis (strain ATCC PRA-98 / G3) TaxID=412133 RepID=A2E5J7_TRIV3|nr:hypothetical protein TVAGG3_0240300 [Trichomonas vaginalis G3]EAY12038.1 hypothetical protein TVAG_038840 [Trichomonas vaginalis G3]KAI5553278.1 hypothetical protein TVAGG3_0240300 [Trichomonas vaginalis G3]|eukprot:XP_001324261.1 hypothetical protein [Trichomonas vaginalis G3]